MRIMMSIIATMRFVCLLDLFTDNCEIGKWVLFDSLEINLGLIFYVLLEIWLDLHYGVWFFKIDSTTTVFTQICVF